jgi:hypothetical protein
LISVVGTLVYDARSESAIRSIGENLSHLNAHCGANGSSLATRQAFAEFPLRVLLVKLDVAVAARENLYENFCLFGTHFYWYGADAILACEHCAR